jgi:hypothetical protein
MACADKEPVTRAETPMALDDPVRTRTPPAEAVRALAAWTREAAAPATALPPAATLATTTSRHDIRLPLGRTMAMAPHRLSSRATNRPQPPPTTSTAPTPLVHKTADPSARHKKSRPRLPSATTQASTSTRASPARSSSHRLKHTTTAGPASPRKTPRTRPILVTSPTVLRNKAGAACKHKVWPVVVYLMM